jgi:hypothetical protein
MSWLAFASFAVSAFGGLSSKGDYDKGAALAIKTGKENAVDLMDMTTKNNALQKNLAEENAMAVINIGYANAAAVELAAARTFAVRSLGTRYKAEQMWRARHHMMGEIRARSSSTGISVNEGSPLHFLNEQAQLAERDIKMTIGMELLSTFGYMADQSERARLIKLETVQRAETMKRNVETANEVALNEAVARAAALRRGSQLTASGMRSQGNAAMWSGFSSGFGSLAAYS